MAVLQGLPGKSGRTRTVGPDPAETGSTGRRQPGRELQQRGQVQRVLVSARTHQRSSFLTVSLRLPPVALLRGVLLLAEGLLAGALLILGLLLTVLGAAYRETHMSAAHHSSGTHVTSRRGATQVTLSKCQADTSFIVVL